MKLAFTTFVLFRVARHGGNGANRSVGLQTCSGVVADVDQRSETEPQLDAPMPGENRAVL